MTQVQWRMKGQYVKNCNCLATCPCDTIGVPAPSNFCESVIGMNITRGGFGTVSLDGLKWVVVLHAPGALHEGNVEVEPYIDATATEAQRSALVTILSGKAGGMYQILSSIISTLHEPQFVPIDFEFDKEQRRARVASPGRFATVSEPLRVPATGAEQRVQVRLPDGFEYKEMEVANASLLWSGGKVKMMHHGTHSSLAEVEQTTRGSKRRP